MGLGFGMRDNLDEEALVCEERWAGGKIVYFYPSFLFVCSFLVYYTIYSPLGQPPTLHAFFFQV